MTTSHNPSDSEKSLHDTASSPSPSQNDTAAQQGCPFGHGGAGHPSSEGHPAAISRRNLLMGAGAVALGLGALGMGGGYALGRQQGTSEGLSQADVLAIKYDFRGEHQPGIITPQQQQMHTAAFDVISSRRKNLIDLLTRWSIAAERMMAGELVGDPKAFRDVPPTDTGETMGLGPGALTITIGFGESLFEKDGEDRFGIKEFMPEPLRGGIPRMAAEKLDDTICYGDLIVQACAEDPMIAMHAIHNMTRIAFGTASLRWSQLGYGRTSSTSTAQLTARNLFGFKDGTSNIKAEETAEELNEHLWIQPEDSAGAWAAGGTYLCTRKIKQMMEVWDELLLSDQEQIIGRDKLHGAPLSGGDEFTDPDFEKTDEAGNPLIPVDSHVAVVNPNNNNGRRMLRRGYNYMEGNDRLGRLEGGLFFIAFVRDPQTNFIPILRKMVNDQMTEYLQHIGTSLFVCPPGLKPGDNYIAQSLFE